MERIEWILISDGLSPLFAFAQMKKLKKCKKEGIKKRYKSQSQRTVHEKNKNHSEGNLNELQPMGVECGERACPDGHLSKLRWSGLRVFLSFRIFWGGRKTAVPDSLALLPPRFSSLLPLHA